MKPITAEEIHASFVNCSKGQAAAVIVPPLEDVGWDELDFLGWRNPRMPERAYLVTARDDRLVGLVFRVAKAARAAVGRTSLCGFCFTVHTAGGVTLFTANRAGAEGRQGNTVGTYLCTDLECSKYIRGKKTSSLTQTGESLSVEDRIARLELHVNSFTDRVLGKDAR